MKAKPWPLPSGGVFFSFMEQKKLKEIQETSNEFYQQLKTGKIKQAEKTLMRLKEKITTIDNITIKNSLFHTIRTIKETLQKFEKLNFEEFQRAPEKYLQKIEQEFEPLIKKTKQALNVLK